MASLQRDVNLRAAAKAAATARKAAAAVSRTGQVSRTSISVRDDDVMLDELMAGAVDTAEVAVEHGEDLALVDDAAVADFETILDAGGAADIGDVIDATDALPDLIDEFEAEAEAVEQNHVAHMLAIEATQNVDEALANAEQAALDAAASLVGMNGKNARRSGKTEADLDVPPSGWADGDEWIVLDDAGKPVEIRVRAGEVWVPFDVVANSALILSPEGTISLRDGLVTAESIAAGAIDAKTIRGAQLYGGYIEAPIIASSDKLGTGANKLNDPEFKSAIDTEWKASGHLGDAPATQRDTITWDQTWTRPDIWPPTVQTYRNWGNVVADRSYVSKQRLTGSVILGNHSRFSKSARSFTNPYKFVNLPTWGAEPSQYGGRIDNTFKAVDSEPHLAGTARTTYLTNSAVISVQAGEVWNLRLGYSRIYPGQFKNIDELAIEVVSASSGVVVFSHNITQQEAYDGSVNFAWNCLHSGDVKYRLKAVYRAGFTTSVRKTTPTSYARQTKAGTQVEVWLGSGEYDKLGYALPPNQSTSSGTNGYGGTRSAEASDIHQTAFNVTSATFAQVEPAKGWRLSEERGFELFNSSGQRTAQLDGEDNFLSGRVATAESGRRLELLGRSLSAFDSLDILRTSISFSDTELILKAPRVKLDGIAELKFEGDNNWTSIPFVSPHTGTCQWRRYHGMVQVRWECTSTIAANELVNPLFVVPEQIAPVIPASATLYGNGGVPYTGRISSNRNAQIRNNGTAASGGHSGWCEYPAN